METVICFLCRVTFQEKEGLKAHLIYEHGVVFNLDFVSQFRSEDARMPVIDLNKKNNNRTRRTTTGSATNVRTPLLQSKVLLISLK